MREILKDLVGIFLLSLSLLAFEIAYAKIVHVQHYGALGYVVIGTALFGFALAGVLLTVNDRLRAVPSRKLIIVSTLLGSLSMLLAYLITSTVPLNFLEFFKSPVRTGFFLAVWYLALATPFFFGGLAIAVLLSREERTVSWLYGADLVGAGLGAILVLPLMTKLGGAGIVWAASALAAISAAAFALGSIRAVSTSLAAAAVIAAAGVSIAPRVDVIVHTPKRGYVEDRDAGLIIKTQWSALSRIDVADRPDARRIWFDGGTMQSHMFHDDGSLELPEYLINSSGPLPYLLRPRNDVCVLASAGGREVMWALANGAAHVDAVELDPTVCDLVRHEYDAYLGGLFNRPDVTLVNEEGRSFIKRATRRYDVIQQVSAYSLATLTLGAAANMDAYLVTVEAIQDYFDRLTDDGVLCISKENGIKLFATAWVALEKLGVDPTDRIYIEQARYVYNHNMILVRKTPFPPSELEILARHVRDLDLEVFYAPPALFTLLGPDWRPSEPDPNCRELLTRIATLGPRERDVLLRSLPFNADVPTDNRPFYNRVNHYLRPIRSNGTLPIEMQEMADSQAGLGPVPLGDIPPLAVLLEALVLAGLVIFLPLRKLGGASGDTPGRWPTLVYFLLLGLGFIALEVILLQRYILFVGSPTTAMSVVLGSLLVWAGLGSIVVSPYVITRPRLIPALFGGIVLMAGVGAALLAPIFNSLLHLSLPVRCAIGSIVLLPLGLLLGAPFPIGLRYAHRQNQRVVAWGWALNGYMTVVGTTAAAIVIPLLGYRAMFVAGGVIYLLAGVCLLMLRHRLPGTGSA